MGPRENANPAFSGRLQRHVWSTARQDRRTVTSTHISSADFSALRQALAELPRADNLSPNQPIDPEDVYTVPEHRAALDPDRALVVGNRGMGKSFWAHALAQEATRENAARILRFKQLSRTTVQIGFNAAEEGLFAPSAEVIAQAQAKSPEVIWRAVLVRIAASLTNDKIPKNSRIWLNGSQSTQSEQQGS